MPAEIIIFYQQLALLIESGVDITTALELLQGQTSSNALKAVLGDVVRDLRGGDQLSTSLSRHPEIFPPIHWRSIRIGEQTGGLEIMLRQIAEYMEREAAAAKGVKNALTYPIIASIVAVVVIGVLVTFVLPAFGALYTSLGAELPLLTKMLIQISGVLQSYGIYLILAVFILAGLAYVYVKTTEGRYKLDKLVLRLPLVGRVSHLKELARCCRSVSLLFRAGLPLTEIMPLVIEGAGNSVMARALTDVQQAMLKGEGISQPMSKNDIFLPMMVQMVKVGEETGSLDATLLSVAQSYEVEAKEKTESIIRLIQPTMTLLIGLVISFIALSMVSAMYSIYGQVL